MTFKYNAKVNISLDYDDTVFAGDSADAKIMFRQAVKEFVEDIDYNSLFINVQIISAERVDG